MPGPQSKQSKGPGNSTPLVPSWMEDAPPTTQYERDLVAKNKCPRCREPLDTGWECTGCGYDCMPITTQTDETEK